MPRQAIAYLITRCSEDRDSYLGAVLTTDDKSLPIEFFHTSPPVRPTRLQRVLYGGALDAYIRRDVIGSPLLKALKERPALVISSDDLVLDLDGEAGCPVVRVQQTNSEPLAHVGDTQELSPTQRLVQLRPKSGPIRVTGPRDDPALLSRVGELLAQLTETMDILEPLDRVAQAVELIWEAEMNGKSVAESSTT
ncbi:MAG TPA: hypothetical protein PLD23_20135 [Armatimonadota bacterium]|nr:hypothetical protein [Armatimonadota bacterium]